MTAIFSEKQHTVRKTFNISEENAKRMKKLLSQRKQTEFVNQAIDNEFKKMAKLENIKTLKQMIKSITPVKSDVSIQDTLDEIRKESLETI
jgi:hypothetical protein